MATSSNQCGATAAPPPTPSTQPNLLPTSSDAADSLSRLFLLRLPPILSPPSRRNSPTTSTCIPTISLSNPTITPSLLLSAASKLGFFQLTDHSIPSQLAHSADSESQSLFHLPNHQKRLRFPADWPLGYDCSDDDDHENGESTDESSFCFDSARSAESDELSLASLREFTRKMEEVGLAVIEALSCAVGFVNPARADPSRVCSLMWISEDTTSQSPGNQLMSPGRIYPYVVGLHYQVRCRKSMMLSDSGWVFVSPQVDSILVTFGDIAQVWSNGKLKKVRGRPVPTWAEGNPSQSVSMSLLLTLPLDSIVSPLLPTIVVDDGSDEVESREDEEYESPNSVEESRVFNSFSFEDYAWRVYHERVLLKDPLDRYRA